LPAQDCHSRYLACQLRKSENSTGRVALNPASDQLRANIFDFWYGELHKYWCVNDPSLCLSITCDGMRVALLDSMSLHTGLSTWFVRSRGATLQVEQLETTLDPADDLQQYMQRIERRMVLVAVSLAALALLIGLATLFRA
jgi:hypothetical protein